MSGRTFGASLKPVWSSEQIEQFLNDTKGMANIYIINHDKDIDENGNQVEAHTHFFIEYDTPRKISTVANLLKVENNFVEIIRNKKGYIRYLTHMDDLDKHQYDDNEVYTNSSISYSDLVLGNSMTDKEIANYIVSGRGMELLGLVSASKLRTIQGFIHFDQSNAVLKEVRAMREKLDTVVDTIDKLERVASSFTGALEFSTKELAEGMIYIANELKQARLFLGRKQKK